MSKFSIVEECRSCGSKELSWDTHNKNGSGVAEGRLRSHEIKCLFVLGCDECSETLAVMRADQIAAFMTEGKIRFEIESK